MFTLGRTVKLSEPALQLPESVAAVFWPKWCRNTAVVAFFASNTALDHLSSETI